jgi:hypothetical protein
MASTSSGTSCPQHQGPPSAVRPTLPELAAPLGDEPPHDLLSPADVPGSEREVLLSLVALDALGS